MRKQTIYITILFTVIMLFSGCNKINFDGSSTGSSDRFVLSYKVLNDSRTHKMTVNEGEDIQVNIQIISGRTDVLVTDSEGKVIYKADNASGGEFALRVSKTSEYTFTVSGKRAKGSVSFTVKR